MKLPNGDRADLGTKLEDYVLNSKHRKGRHKARVFASALGITRVNRETLANALLEVASNSNEASRRATTGRRDVRNSISRNHNRRHRNCAQRLDDSTRRRLSTAHNLFYHLAIPTKVQLHDVVALMEDVDTKHFLTHEPVRLRRGQVGTVVMPLNDDHYQVEFADCDGRAYARLPLSSNQLMVLREQPDTIPA